MHIYKMVNSKAKLFAKLTNQDSYDEAQTIWDICLKVKR